MQGVVCEGIVLGLLDYGEADRIVNFFTPEHGKVRGIARGARKSRKRFGGALELFALLRLELRLREGLSTIGGAEILNLYYGVRRDLAKIARASYACELADRFLLDGQPAPRLFRLLSSWLERMDRHCASDSDRRFFEVNLLNILGYRLHLDGCASCGAEVDGIAPIRYSASAGGVLCPACGKTGRTISPAAISLLKKCMATGRFGVVSFPPDELEEAGRMLDSAIAVHLSRPLNSLAFLREVEGA